MSDVGDDKNIQKLVQNRLLYFLFTIPHEGFSPLIRKS